MDSSNNVRRSAGGIVLGDQGTIALVWSRNSQTWLFPKGGIDEGETDEEAARREIKEETGLTDLEYLDDLGTFERPSPRDEVRKSIHMFLFAAPVGAKLAPTHEIEKAEWVSFRESPTIVGTGTHPEWFAADRAWYATVFERVRQAIQRD
jgi:8-oxo-dGTP pyrophosphatase MutT (NUDIX family)